MSARVHVSGDGTCALAYHVAVQGACGWVVMEVGEGEMGTRRD